MSRSHVSLRVGEEHEVRLPGLSAAGYRWSHELEGEGDAVEIEPSPRPQAALAVGSSPDEIFTITAVRPGRVAIRFEQRRRWEADVQPRRIFMVNVDVEG
jgi:predicted secreted protein